MNPSMTSRRPRWAPILVVVAVAAATIVAVPFAWEPVLRNAGWALIVNEPVAHADIIVIVPGGGGAEAFEAADLVQSGIATRVAVFADPPSGEDHEFIRRGLPYEDAAARQIDQLKWLGVTDVAQIPRADAETEVLTVLGGLAEFERELICARTGEGRKRAKDRGVRFGRPRKMTPHQRQEALQLLAAGETYADVARTYNVDATTIGRLAAASPFERAAVGGVQ